MEIFRPQIRERKISHLRALVAIAIVSTACCVGCGAKNINDCPGDAGSSTRCEIFVSGGSPSGSVSRDSPAEGASAAGSTPAAGLTQSSPVTADPEPAVGSSSAATESPVPLMTPIINQPGWTLAWSGQKTIGPPGVIFSEVNPTSGPETGNGDEFDLQYIASGSGDGWGSNLNYLNYWTYKYQPGPAIIAGLLNNQNFSGEDPAGMLAQVGNRLFAAMDTEAEGFDIAFYMQVLAVGEDGVLVDMWVWNSA